MHHARGVCGLQRVEHAEHQRERLVRRQCATRAQMLGERASRNEFEDEVGLPVVHVGLEHRHDVRVGEAADAARLLQPGGHVLRIGVGTGAQQLDRNLAFEAGGEAEPDGRLGPLAQLAPKFEAAEASRGHGDGRMGSGHRRRGGSKGDVIQAGFALAAPESAVAVADGFRPKVAGSSPGSTLRLIAATGAPVASCNSRGVSSSTRA